MKRSKDASNPLDLTDPGIVSYDDQGRFFSRKIQAGSQKIQIQNADGVADSPSIDVIESSFDRNAIGGGDPLSVQFGGTGKETFTTNSLLVGNENNAIGEVAPGSAGQVLIVDETTIKFSDLPKITIKTEGAITSDKETVSLGDTLTLTGAEAGGWGVQKWNVLTTETTADIQTGQGYLITNPEASVTLNLPSKAQAGDLFWITGTKNCKGWSLQLTQDDQIVSLSNLSTNTKGSIVPIDPWNNLQCICLVTDKEWIVMSCIGNFNFS